MISEFSPCHPKGEACPPTRQPRVVAMENVRNCRNGRGTQGLVGRVLHRVSYPRVNVGAEQMWVGGGSDMATY